MMMMTMINCQIPSYRLILGYSLKVLQSLVVETSQRNTKVFSLLIGDRDILRSSICFRSILIFNCGHYVGGENTFRRSSEVRFISRRYEQTMTKRKCWSFAAQELAKRFNNCFSNGRVVCAEIDVWHFEMIGSIPWLFLVNVGYGHFLCHCSFIS
jgi:hypothetical protein